MRNTIAASPNMNETLQFFVMPDEHQCSSGEGYPSQFRPTSSKSFASRGLPSVMDARVSVGRAMDARFKWAGVFVVCGLETLETISAADLE